MKILVACEYSGVVRDTLSNIGHDVTSADILDSLKPGQHYKGNVLDILNDGWDMLIAHPPCRYICNSGVHHLHKDKTRWDKLDEACKFFCQLWNSNIPKICIENSIPHKYAVKHPKYPIGRYTHTIQPYEFGHYESKRTCLWLKGLPPLEPTNIVKKPECGYWNNQTPSGQNKLGPSKNRHLLRAKTYKGIALAMANQWTKNV